jgi:hypothetical protein
MIKSLTDYAQKNGIKVERLQNHPEFHSKYDSFVETMPDMSRAIDGGYLGKIVQNTSALEGDLAHEVGHVKTFKSRTGREIKRFRGTPEYPQLIRRNSRGKAFLDDKNYVLQRVADNVISVANENSASAYGNALLKKLGSPRLGILERNQSDALSSYMGLSANHIGHDIRESLRWT